MLDLFGFEEAFGLIGSALGAIIDAQIVAALTPTQKQQGPRLDDLRVTSSTEGAVIPRVFGKMKVGGNIIWATDFREESSTSTQGGKGGGGGGVEVTEYRYFASFAVALCEGPISGIGRIWADGKLFDVPNAVYRVYTGTEDQEPDPHIEAKTGPSPAYRGTAYVVFEDLPLERFGNRLPQLSFEVIRPGVQDDSAENLLQAVNIIPSTGEYVYATEQVTRGSGGNNTAENVNAESGKADFLVSLDALEAAAPNCKSVSLVVSWFGTDLRAGSCQIRPGVEDQGKTVSKAWAVNGVSRGAAYEVSNIGGSPVYGGTPADFAVVQAIKELKERGFKVTFYPFVLMDIPAGNALPNPYSANAATNGQPVYPWRGRITCSPAAGYTGTVDKTAAAATQISAFFGSAAVGDYSVNDGAVSWTGSSSEWGLRRMILHYAHLCEAAGGVDAFLIGSELRGVTRIRSAAGTFPAVTALKTLAADVRSILGAGTKLSYAADWSEYFGHQPGDGSGDIYFHLDALWADANVDFVGIDNYFPMSDWREGGAHLDAAAWPSIHDLDYLRSNIEGGEGFDWYYASDAARNAQTRTTIADSGYGKPWVFRPKDVRNWWLNQHFNRPGGVQSGTATAWVPQSKPIRFTEAGCPAVDKGTNQPNVFYDPKSSESFLPWYSRGTPDDLIQRRYVEALYTYWGDNTKNPASGVYSGRMIDVANLAIWTWDARPFPAFPARADVWGDAENWRLGHWLNGRLGMSGLAALVRELCLRTGIDGSWIDTAQLEGTVSGYLIGSLDSARGSIEPLQRFFGFDAAESEGVIRFVSRGGASVATITPAELLVANDRGGDDISLTRAQETELARALKWRLVNPDEEYGGLTVEARRIAVDTVRITSENFEIACGGSIADRNVRRALYEEWVGRDDAAFSLPPSRLALDPTDVVLVEHDGRHLEFALTRVSDAEGRKVEARRMDPMVYDLPPGPERPIVSTPPAVHGPPLVRMLNLPQLSSSVSDLAAYAAVYAHPWWGKADVYRQLWLEDLGDESSSKGMMLLNYSKAATVIAPANFGTLGASLPAGPLHRFDLGNEIILNASGASLQSISDLGVFTGANALAIETAPNVWEIVQFGVADLVGVGQWRISRLLRGQLGTEDAMGAPAAAGSLVLILNAAVTPVPLALEDISTDSGWSTVSPNGNISNAAYNVAFDHTGRGLRPFSPAQQRGVLNAGGSMTLSWLRRSRSPAADNWALAEVPDEPGVTERYRLQILDGSTVKRTVDLGAGVTSWTYTTAMMTADFGAPVTSVTWRVAQQGQLGLGAWAKATT